METKRSVSAIQSIYDSIERNHAKITRPEKKLMNTEKNINNGGMYIMSQYCI